MAKKSHFLVLAKYAIFNYSKLYEIPQKPYSKKKAGNKNSL